MATIAAKTQSPSKKPLPNSHKPQQSIFQSFSAPATQSADIDVEGPLSPAMVISLQRTIGNQAVQRLMSVADFQANSKLSGQSFFKRDRNNVTAIDTALGAYNPVGAHQAATIANKKALADALIIAIDNYVAGTGKRKKAVRKLRLDVVRELSIINPLEGSLALGPVAAFEAVVEAQDIQVKVISAGLMSPLHPLVSFDGWLTNAIGAMRANPLHIQQAIQNDLDELTNIMNSPATPQITRDILGEVLANTGDVHFNEANPGARKRKAAETFGENYVVNHNLNAPGGTPERLGSLTHELTHVSISETFSNTVLFLAFEAGYTNDQIKALSAKRTDQLTRLEALMNSDPTFDADKKELLENKVQYPYKGPKGDMNRYLDTMGAQMPPLTVTRMRTLASQGVNNTMIEFDTVINQMMIYMHTWGIPKKNKFYTLLTQVAQEAYDYRAAARG